MSSLLNFIHHKPVAAPTYFDLLPIDVLRHHLMPFLGWEDRINLNQMFPSADRILPNKISKTRIIEHQLASTKQAFELKLFCIRLRCTSASSQIRKNEVFMQEMREFIKPSAMLIAQYSPNVWRNLVNKLNPILDPTQLAKTFRRLEQRNEMKALLIQLVDNMKRFPQQAPIHNARHLIQSRVTQNETDLFHSGPGYQWRQGDIYSVME